MNQAQTPTYRTSKEVENNQNRDQRLSQILLKSQNIDK